MMTDVGRCNIDDKERVSALKTCEEKKSGIIIKIKENKNIVIHAS